MSNGKNGNGNGDVRLIEDYMPIEAISAAAEEKRQISGLHLWWARRPLVACRAAVYAALVPADQWVREIEVKNPPKSAAKLEAMKAGAKRGLNRRAAGEFMGNLCRFGSEPRYIQQAQEHILAAHAVRLSQEVQQSRKSNQRARWIDEFGFKGENVTVQDIVKGHAPRPRVLDPFSGGGAIPLEALRLGCDTHALDLNPVAHVVQLCTLLFPHKYCSADSHAAGKAGERRSDGGVTWGGLDAEVRYWSDWVMERARAELAPLYPLLRDPSLRGRSKHAGDQATMWKNADAVPHGYLLPITYFWTRTVRCKNPACGATVPLLKQSWLCKKAGRFIALKMIAPRNARSVRFEVVEAKSESGLGFDPTAFSEAGNATCPFCGTVADNDYVKREACGGRLGQQSMGAACLRAGQRGKIYLSPEADVPLCATDKVVQQHIDTICKRFGVKPVDEVIEANPRSMDVQNLGIVRWSDLYAPRQMAAMLAFTGAVHAAIEEAAKDYGSRERATAVCAYLALAIDKLADYGNSLCAWHYGNEQITHLFKQQSLPIVWDFAETNPLGGTSGSWKSMVESTLDSLVHCQVGSPGSIAVTRGSATELSWEDASFDAVITDPPYYDNVSYSNLSDFFYVWLKRSIGGEFPSHFASALTPKKKEAIAATYRHDGDKSASRAFYESMMAQAFAQAHRVLKADGIVTVVYAHKTTLGWATLVDAMRTAGFTVTEAWPLDTEMKNRFVARDTAALASSIFLVGRKRESSAAVGGYENDVQPELVRIVRERVDTLWDMGITGADLVIAAVGAGLRSFTRFAKVEYANGEEVPAEKFLAEVEAVVLDAMLAKLSGATGGNISAVDNASRFYVLWRFVYKIAELDAGEAIVFSNGTHIELDGPQGLSAGSDALVEKKKAKYRMMDFAERGDNARLGLPAENGQPPSTIDVLHRILWLMENSPRKLKDFLDEARPDRERVRVLAQALAGAALSGKSEEESAKLVSTTPAEQAALGKLLANWRSLIESRMAEEEGTLFGKQGR